MNKSLLTMVITLIFYGQTVEAKGNEYDVNPLLSVSFEKAKISDWGNQLFSEKLDGIRAIWTGSQLVTRQNKRIFAPDWFVQSLPNYPVEGELWAGRGQFEQVLSVVMDKVADPHQWRSIEFMIFDLPAHLGPFSERYKAFQQLVVHMNAPHIHAISHAEAITESNVMENLHKVVNGGGEGLMLRDKQALYQVGRHQGVVKLKITDDAEAQVIGYVAGNGKYHGQMGSLRVKMPNGIIFKIGTGFTDAQRLDPPPIGSQITYRHNGFTKKGIPKFARFWRIDRSK